MLKRADKIIFESVHFFVTQVQKAKGLMFSKKIDKAYIFIFSKSRRMDMHMFFVFFPIDVLFLDHKRRIVEIKENFRPFTFYYSKEKANYVIELPSGSIIRHRLKVGQVLNF